MSAPRPKPLSRLILAVGASLIPAVFAVAACAPRGPSLPVAELIPIDDGSSPIRIELGTYRTAVARMRITRDDSIYAKPLPENLKAYVLDRLIDEALLQREAERLGVRASTLAVSREMALLRASMPSSRFRRLLVDSYQTEKDLEVLIEKHLTAISTLERLTMRNIEVTEAEIQGAWEALPPSQRVRPERVRAAQILVETEPEAVKIWRALRRRGKFDALAKKHSISPEAAEGGDLGWFARGELPTVFDDMCFPLKKGYFSHVTASEYGYHICKVLDREPQRGLTLDEVRADLKHELQTDKVRQAHQQLMARLRGSVKIVKHKRVIARVK